MSLWAAWLASKLELSLLICAEAFVPLAQLVSACRRTSAGIFFQPESINTHLEKSDTYFEKGINCLQATRMSVIEKLKQWTTF